MISQQGHTETKTLTLYEMERFGLTQYMRVGNKGSSQALKDSIIINQCSKKSSRLTGRLLVGSELWLASRLSFLSINSSHFNISVPVQYRENKFVSTMWELDVQAKWRDLSPFLRMEWTGPFPFGETGDDRQLAQVGSQRRSASNNKHTYLLQRWKLVTFLQIRIVALSPGRGSRIIHQNQSPRVSSNLAVLYWCGPATVMRTRSPFIQARPLESCFAVGCRWGSGADRQGSLASKNSSSSSSSAEYKSNSARSSKIAACRCLSRALSLARSRLGRFMVQILKLVLTIVGHQGSQLWMESEQQIAFGTVCYCFSLSTIQCYIGGLLFLKICGG